MTPTETAGAVAYAHEQWPHYTIAPHINDIWHTHLRHTDKHVVLEALNELLGVVDRPPTIAQVRTQIAAIHRRRDNLNRPALGPATMIPLEQVGCGAARCDWLDELARRHTPDTWAALTSDQRIREHMDHARSHAGQFTRPLRKLFR